MRGRLGLAIASAFAIACACSAGCGDNRAGGGDGSPGPDATVPHRRVLFIGNSYTYVNDLPGVVAALSREPQSPAWIDVDSHTPGGATWDDHDADPAVDDLIAQGWDVVVLQDQSQEPWLRAAAPPALISLDAKI